MTTIRCLTCAFAALLPLFAAGCGKGSPVPARGQVTYRNYPVTNGLVVFTPENRGPLAVGRITNDGSFVLYTGENPGAYPGKYHITVCSLAAGAMASETGGRFEFPSPAVPPKYREFAESGVWTVIEPNKSNNIPIPLKD
jgi:hypothetical protein